MSCQLPITLFRICQLPWVEETDGAPDCMAQQTWCKYCREWKLWVERTCRELDEDDAYSLGWYCQPCMDWIDTEDLLWDAYRDYYRLLRLEKCRLEGLIKCLSKSNAHALAVLVETLGEASELIAACRLQVKTTMSLSETSFAQGCFRSGSLPVLRRTLIVFVY